MFERKHSTNSRESFVSGIAETPLLDLEKTSTRSSGVIACRATVGLGLFFEAVEDANDFLHGFHFILKLSAFR